MEEFFSQVQVEVPGTLPHAVCDFRKLLSIDCYSLTDNVSELTARINDDSFENSYSEILKFRNQIRMTVYLFFLEVVQENKT